MHVIIINVSIIVKQWLEFINNFLDEPFNSPIIIFQIKYILSNMNNQCKQLLSKAVKNKITLLK